MLGLKFSRRLFLSAELVISFVKVSNVLWMHRNSKRHSTKVKPPNIAEIQEILKAHLELLRIMCADPEEL